MSPLRLPIKDRKDIILLGLDVSKTTDREIEQHLKALCGPCENGHRSHLVRVVPLEDRGAYNEALETAIAHVGTFAEAVWIIDPACATFGVRMKDLDGSTYEKTRTVRVFQVLTN